MYRVMIVVSLLIGFSGVQAATGFRQMALDQDDSRRPLPVAVWYPTADKPSAGQKLSGDNAAFVGEPVIENAVPLTGRYPLVVLSHGVYGNWNNQLWLARALVEQGFIVAAANHPGTSTWSRDPAVGASLWQRPQDISRIITALTAQSAAANSGQVASDKIAVIGHSLGGWTAMELAGARFDVAQFTQDCGAHPAFSSCQVWHQLGAGRTAQAIALLEQDLRDKRVRAVVSLDLGLARGLRADSLAAVSIPVLVIAAGAEDRQLPAAMESRPMADKLPAASHHYLAIDDATHFSFMMACKPGASALLEQETAGDGIVCQDGGQRSRQAIHQQISAAIVDFLLPALQLRPGTAG